MLIFPSMTSFDHGNTSHLTLHVVTEFLHDTREEGAQRRIHIQGAYPGSNGYVFLFFSMLSSYIFLGFMPNECYIVTVFHDQMSL